MQANLTAAPCHTSKHYTTLHYTTETDDAHLVVALSALSQKKSYSLIFKAPTPENCKDEGSDLPPQKAVASRYLSAA